jgi:hypothetical protein
MGEAGGQAAQAQRGKEKMRADAKKVHGVFEKIPGSGIWWIQYFDADGRRRREKVGTKSNAIKLYQKRKNESLQGKKLPETLRKRDVTLGEIASATLEYSLAKKASYRQDKVRMVPIVHQFGNCREHLARRIRVLAKP